MPYFVRTVKRLAHIAWAAAASWNEAQLTARRRKAAAAHMARFQPPYKLHFGCGPVLLQGWINIDLHVNPAKGVVWDVTKPFPLPDNSCRCIYHEHLLEHLPPAQGAAFLKDCHRLLMPGGVVRIAMPSLQYVIEKYQSGDWREQDWLQWPEYRFVQTRAEMVNVALRWWGHQWLYDQEELRRYLSAAGFQAITEAPWGGSAHPELRNLETRADSKLICEAAKSPAAAPMPDRLEIAVSCP
jgi:predicted SAM-dependent methyltransferase